MNETQKWLMKWFERRGRPLAWPADATSDFVKQGLIDSFGVVELIEDLESHFGFRFSEADLNDPLFATLGGLLELVQSKRG